LKLSSPSALLAIFVLKTFVKKATRNRHIYGFAVRPSSDSQNPPRSVKRKINSCGSVRSRFGGCNSALSQLQMLATEAQRHQRLCVPVAFCFFSRLNLLRPFTASGGSFPC